MELQKESAAFTAIKATRVVSEDGSRCMNFQDGETRPVHHTLFAAALKAGLVPQTELNMPEPAAPASGRSTQQVVEHEVLDAVRTLVARGNPADFTQWGKPRTASVKKLVNCHFTGADVQRAFEQAMFEVEQGGNESTEHSEPGSSAS